MATYDYRTVPPDEYAPSFYVFDNMAVMRQGEGGNLYRFDTAQEAAGNFRIIQAAHPEWEPALGIHAIGIDWSPQEIDLVHGTRDGSCFLLTDYRHDSRWGNDRDMGLVAGELAESLGIEWQTDWSIMGGSALVPYAPYDRPESPELANMALRPKDPENAFTSVSSALVAGKGWVGTAELRGMAELFEAGLAERPKVSSLTVSYEDVSTGRMGDVPVNPHDLKGMEGRFQELKLQRERERAAAHAAEERASWPNGQPPLPDTGMPFFDFADGYGDVRKVNLAVGVHEGTDNLFVGADCFNPGTGEMDDGPRFTANILKLPPFVAALDVEYGGERIAGFLAENGFGHLTGDVLHNGSRTFPLFRFDEAKLEEANEYGIRQYRERSGLDERRRQAERDGLEPLDFLKERAHERAAEKNLSRIEKPSTRNHDIDI